MRARAAGRVRARPGVVVRMRAWAALQATAVGTAGPHAPTDPPRGEGGTTRACGAVGVCAAMWTRAGKRELGVTVGANRPGAEGKLFGGRRRVGRVHPSRSYGPRGVRF